MINPLWCQVKASIDIALRNHRAVQCTVDLPKSGQNVELNGVPHHLVHYAITGFLADGIMGCVDGMTERLRGRDVQALTRTPGLDPLAIHDDSQREYTVNGYPFRVKLRQDWKDNRTWVWMIEFDWFFLIPCDCTGACDGGMPA